MNIFDRILQQDEFKNNPPVLIDIGASGSTHKDWSKISKYSVCVAFDADKRDFQYIETESKYWLKLYLIDKVVTDKQNDKIDFYLTSSPYCSSSLKPNTLNADNWAFKDLFELKETRKLKSISLPQLIAELKINKIDWFKTDSQGTDLRLFKSLGENTIGKVLIAEFEPGLIDLYDGEDKAFSILEFMDKKPFWLTDLAILGTQRINYRIMQQNYNWLQKKYLRFFIKTSPGWANISYMNCLNEDFNASKRDYLLICLFAIIKKQWGFALEKSIQGYNLFNDDIFLRIRKYIKRKEYSCYLILFFFVFKRAVFRLLK